MGGDSTVDRLAGTVDRLMAGSRMEIFKKTRDSGKEQGTWDHARE
jgi:hypothetical protein